VILADFGMSMEIQMMTLAAFRLELTFQITVGSGYKQLC